MPPTPHAAQSESWYEPRTGDHRWRQSGDYAAYGDLATNPAPSYPPAGAGPIAPPPYGQTGNIPRQQGGGLAPRSGDGYPSSLHSVSAPPAYGSPTSGLPAPYNPPGRTVVARRQVTVAAPPADDEPEYRRAITYTSAWYAVPGVLYLAWALTLESSRRTFVLHNFTASLFWLFGAAVLSLLVATILSWAAREWRSLTVSFAATVIGAGIATVAHSLALGS
jgi:hypothetical protein